MLVYKKSDSSITIPVGLGPNVGPLDAKLEEKTVDSSTSIQHVTADPGYDALSGVTVNPYTLESLEIDPSTTPQAFTPEADGYSSVTVNAVDASIDSDILPENIKTGVDILGVTGSFSGGPLQSKSVDSSTTAQVIEPDDGYYGLSSVTVDAVDASIDQNIQPENIKAGVDILGVTGSFEGFNWLFDARKGIITDVSCYSLEGLPAYTNGAMGILWRAPITTLPRLGTESVAARGLVYAFSGTGIARADVSLSDIGEEGMQNAFYSCDNLRDASVNIADGRGASSAFNYAFGNIQPEPGSSVNIDVSVGYFSDSMFSGAFSNFNYNGYDCSLNINFNNFADASLSNYCFGNMCDNTRGHINVKINTPTHKSFSAVNNTFYSAFQSSDIKNAPGFMNRIQDIQGEGNFGSCFQYSRLEHLELGVRLISGGYNFSWAFAYCSNLESVTLNGVFEQNTDGANFVGAFEGTPLRSATFTALAGTFPLMYDIEGVNVLSSATGLEDISLWNVSGPIYLRWQPNLTRDSVYEILSKAAGAVFPAITSSAPREIYFYDGGLSVTDWADGRLQTAYDAASADGWTIGNLTIVPN